MSKALLFIHGFLTGTDDWDYFLPAFEKDYDAVILFRQPGHSRAEEKPNYKEFTLARTYEELDKTIDGLKSYDEVDVVGHSMGGGMALYAAAHLPNVRRAVAISPALKYPHFGFISKKNRVIKRLRALASASDGELAAALAESADRIAEVYKQGTAIFKKRLFPHWSPHNLITFARIMKRAKKCLKSVTCPLTVIWGELDEFVPRSSPELIMKRVGSRDKRLIVYGDMGHGMLYEKNAPGVVRDVRAALGDADFEFGKAELRTVYRYTENGTQVTRHAVRLDDGKAREFTESSVLEKKVKNDKNPE